MEMSGPDPALVAFILIGVIALVVFVGMAKLRSMPTTEVWLIGSFVLLSCLVAPQIIKIVSQGRGIPSETLPYVMALALAFAFGLLYWRTRREPDHTLKKAVGAPEPGKIPARPGPSSPATPAPVKTIFISYRRDDSADATGRLYDRLVQEFGREHVYKDVDNIPFGVDFREHINKLVTGCDLVLTMIGRDWLNMTGADDRRRLDDDRDPVRIEIATALQRDIPVIPVLVGGGRMPDADALPEEIAGLAFRNGIQVRPDPDFHRDVNRLIAGIRGKDTQGD